MVLASYVYTKFLAGIVINSFRMISLIRLIRKAEKKEKKTIEFPNDTFYRIGHKQAATEHFWA